MLKHFIYIFAIIILSLGCGSAAQQQFRTHKVAKGETVFSISKEYGVDTEAIYRLNPEARNGLSVNSILLLPNTEGDVIVQSSVRTKVHKVGSKETLYSIAQLYNVSVEEIKKYNKNLYSSGLKKGDRILIPIGPKEESQNEKIIDIPEGMAQYTVQPKETKFGIARKYGISLNELQKLNPKMGDTLKTGMELIVPAKEVADTAKIDEDKYQFYEVLPKEGFYRLKVKLGLTEDEIIDLNPYAKEGLKEGMILKIPKKGSVVKIEDIKSVDLSNRIINTSKKHLVLLLPFRANRSMDSTQTNTSIIESDPTLRIALDFYSGALMAAEFAKDKGISVLIDVYDTQKDESKIESIITGHDFKNVDAVIGPLLQANVEKAASLLKQTATPIFSPLSNRDIKMSTNLFQTLPSQEMLEDALIAYFLKNEAKANFILVADSKHNTQKETFNSALPNLKIVNPRGGGYLHAADVSSNFEQGKENWVILESNNSVLVSNVVSLLNGFGSANRVRLFTTDKNDAFEYDEVKNIHLANLNFTFPSVNKTYIYGDRNPFLISYKNKYGVLPNRFAVRGFDITLDVLLRLASANDMYEATDGTMETEYVENKFRYSKKLFSGYQNEAIYIMKYNKDLQFEVVE